MVLYIVRHAEAIEKKDGQPDEWRHLTEKGRSCAEKMGSVVSKQGPKPRLTITSPLTRAVQTAEIMARKACRRNVVIASEQLLPDADVEALANSLTSNRSDKRVMIVGHEPQLGLLTARLLHRTDTEIALAKGSCVALNVNPDKPDKPAEFLWYQAPGKKLRTSLKKAF